MIRVTDRRAARVTMPARVRRAVFAGSVAYAAALAAGASIQEAELVRLAAAEREWARG